MQQILEYLVPVGTVYRFWNIARKTVADHKFSTWHVQCFYCFRAGKRKECKCTKKGRQQHEKCTSTLVVKAGLALAATNKNFMHLVYNKFYGENEFIFDFRLDNCITAVYSADHHGCARVKVSAMSAKAFSVLNAKTKIPLPGGPQKPTSSQDATLTVPLPFGPLTSKALKRLRSVTFIVTIRKYRREETPFLQPRLSDAVKMMREAKVRIPRIRIRITPEIEADARRALWGNVRSVPEAYRLALKYSGGKLVVTNGELSAHRQPGSYL
ncbi:hypothetical protein QBC35DRAFT_471104 [Podospora australis]|uniref:Uncharacterized protein n=1 Tax=Podospora australis TaxID=1536484 RepID=A0AAN6WZ78_9PEZI|nr:hypothetical protein QBC35DRAFT_471104 [Podospora australis]